MNKPAIIKPAVGSTLSRMSYECVKDQYGCGRSVEASGEREHAIFDEYEFSDFTNFLLFLSVILTFIGRQQCHRQWLMSEIVH